MNSEIEFGEEFFDDLERQMAPLSDNAIEEAYENASLRVIYQSNNFFLPQLKDLVDGREILNLRPEYQRRLRWSRKQKSLLIESLLLNIPVPPVFFYESESARYEVMDGQQRINAIYQFQKNDFSLSGLEELNFLNGKRYRDLPPKVKRGMDRASLSATVLLKETIQPEDDPYQVRRYVFERLNTGGKRLNAQEMRNSIYQGTLNEAIIDLSRVDTFCQVFGIPLYTETDENEFYENPARQKNSLYSTMRDCEIVLRCLALVKTSGIKGSMKSILDSYMKNNRVVDDATIDEMKRKFVDGCDFWVETMKSDAFKLPPNANNRRRVSVALFDASMAAIIRQHGRIDQLKANAASLREQILEVVNNPDNEDLVVGRLNTSKAIKDRIGLIANVLNQF